MLCLKHKILVAVNWVIKSKLYNYTRVLFRNANINIEMIISITGLEFLSNIKSPYIFRHLFGQRKIFSRKIFLGVEIFSGFSHVCLSLIFTKKKKKFLVKSFEFLENFLLILKGENTFLNERFTPFSIFSS